MIHRTVCNRTPWLRISSTSDPKRGKNVFVAVSRPQAYERRRKDATNGPSMRCYTILYRCLMELEKGWRKTHISRHTFRRVARSQPFNFACGSLGDRTEPQSSTPLRDNRSLATSCYPTKTVSTITRERERERA